MRGFSPLDRMRRSEIQRDLKIELLHLPIERTAEMVWASHNDVTESNFSACCRSDLHQKEQL